MKKLISISGICLAVFLLSSCSMQKNAQAPQNGYHSPLKPSKKVYKKKASFLDQVTTDLLEDYAKKVSGDKRPEGIIKVPKS